MFDLVEELGSENASRFILLLEKKPKWLLLVLYLRKRIRLSISEARRLLKISYTSLENAIRYLAGRPGNPGYFIASTLYRPLLAVEMLSHREKYLVLTEHGREFADQVIRFLKKIALRFGRIRVEDELGIPRIEVLEYMSRALKKYGIMDYHGYEERIISWDRLVDNLLSTYPLLLKIMDTEIIDAIPFEVEVSGRKHVLHVVL